MLLAVDIGNTETSFGVFEANQLIHHWRGQTRGRGTSDEWASFLLPLLEHHGIQRSQFSGVALCSVVPTVDSALEKFSLDYFHLKPFWVQWGIQLPFDIRVDEPHAVGADRFANAAYAALKLPLPSLVIDIGTATTFDVISSSSSYEGGIILPGLFMGMEALGTKTSKLPLVELVFPTKVIGKSTVDCIRSGILFGYCDLLDGLIDRIENEIGEKSSLVLTGGASSLLHDRLKHKTALLPDLTLEGIRLLYEQNTKN